MNIEKLVDLINEFNDSGEKLDRGRPNNALVLVLYDDGSGFLGTQFGIMGNDKRHNIRDISIAEQKSFNNIKELKDFIKEFIGE